MKLLKKYSITHFLIDVNKPLKLAKSKSVWESEEFALLEVNI